MCCERPRWDAEISWLYMWRTKPDNTDILRNPNGGVVLSGSDFNDFGPKSGIDASLIYRRPRGGAIDVRYLWIDAYTSERSTATLSGPSTINTATSSLVGFAGEPAQFRYLSKLQTAEINVRKEFRNFDWLLGIRYADFRESLDGRYLYAGSLFDTQSWRVGRNDLYGVQTGVDALLWEPFRGFRIGGFGKAGIYYDDIRTSFEAGYYQTPNTPASADTCTSKAAFLGELGVNATYNVNTHVALRTGYQMLWLSGVATAVDQVPATGTFNARPGTIIDSSVNANSSVFYHGVNAGLEFMW
jgi:hypothetical protein